MRRKMVIRSVKSLGNFKSAAFCTVFCAAFSALAQMSGIQEQAKLDPFEFEIPAEATMNEVKDRRNILETNIFQLVRMGDRFFKSFQYKKAFDSYEQALRVFQRQNLGTSAYLQDVKNRISKRSDTAHKSWAEAEFRNARRIYTQAMSKGATNAAEEAFKEAKAISYRAFGIYYYKSAESYNKDRMRNDSVRNPGFYNLIMAFQNDCDKMIASIRFQIDTSLDSIDPDYKDRRKRIQENLKKARAYYRQKKYENVRALVEKILREDNYNEAAINLLEKTYQRLYKVAAYRRQLDGEQKIMDVDWKWVEAYPESGEFQNVNGEKRGLEDGAIAANIGKDNLEFYRKLKGIILPELGYSQETIESIAKDLSARSVTENGERVEIVPDSDIKDRRINSLSLNQASLWTWLKYLCRLGKINFHLDGKYVVLTQGGRALETQSHPISIAYANRIRDEIGGTAGAAKNEEENELDFDEELEDITEARDKAKDARKNVDRSIDPEKLKTFFLERGVPFPEGASISYDKDSGSLSMRNTRANHEKLADRIRVLDVESPMVMVEAKVMEISMAAMEELGFDWTFTYETSRNRKRYFSTSGEFPSGLMYSTNDEANVLVNNLNLLPNVGGKLNANLFLSIRAIDTSERAEIITMPRATVLSNAQATLTVGDERSFPSEYDKPEIEVNDNGNSITYNPPVPDFEVQTLGLNFTVKPTVMNYKTIDVDFNTQLTKFIGWSNYDYTIKIGEKFQSIADSSTTNLQPKEKTPVMSERRIQTHIQVYDGESVVIGGVIQDETAKVDDKYPLFGDLPLIGRLFTNRSNTQAKSNMMIFVTARIMRSDGLPEKQKRREDGLFNFINR